MVSVLNRTVAAFFIIVLSTVFARPDEGRPTVRTLRVSRLSPSTIKPCQRVTALLELQLDRGATPKEWRRIIRRLSETVRMNGSEFRNRLTSLSGSNDACQFGLVDPHSESNANSKPVLSPFAEVVVDCFANLRERVCLFSEPGKYEIAFEVGEQTATLSVVVEEPTTEEARIVEFVNDVKMLLYLMDPVELKTAPRKTIESLKQLAKIDSDYCKMLSRP